MANHKWQNNKCVQCSIIRRENSNNKYPNSISPEYEYSINDGKTWSSIRPDCIINDKNIDTKPAYSIKNALKEYTNKNDYKNLLKNPRWQKKRLLIMQRDNWKCKCCLDDDSELHVHHLKYTAEKPWEEEDDNLITVCDTCHRAIHYLKNCPDITYFTFRTVCNTLKNV